MSPTTDDVLLEVDALSVSFGGVHAVRNLSFNVARNSITGLIGPNGAGKSTAIHCISGMVQPDAGRIHFAGEDLTRLPPYRIAESGLIRTFQVSSDFPRLTVLENLMAAPRGQTGEVWWKVFTQSARWRAEEETALAEAERLLVRFGLAHLKNEYALNLSGGQKRLLELARALMTHPKMLLLDEPIAGINPALADQILQHLRNLRDEGVTLLVVEHELGFIERLCDTVLVMVEGRLLAEGSMEVIRKNERVVEAYLA